MLSIYKKYENCECTMLYLLVTYNYLYDASFEQFLLHNIYGFYKSNKINRIIQSHIEKTNKTKIKNKIVYCTKNNNKQ